MSDQTATDAALSRQVQLDQLVLPPDDVREGRSSEGVQSIASSMGDPDVGQQQPIAVYPNDYAEVVDDGTEDELDDLFGDGHPLVIHDGVTRYRAAEMLGWDTLWAVIVPAPPENEVVARLEANTERLDMSDPEIYKALYDHYQSTEATLDDVGEKVGASGSYMSRVFSLLDAPEWLREPWEHPQHPLGTSHAMACLSFLSGDTAEAYADAGGLTEQEAHERAVEDARLMVDVQQQHDLQVGDFRDRCQRKKKETIDQLQDQRSPEQKQADGQRKAADSQHTDPDEARPDPCSICGGERPNRRRYALNVCESDYGMLSELEANGNTLVANAETAPADGQPALEDVPPRQKVAQGLHEAYGLPKEEAAGFFDEVGDQIQQAQEATGDD